MRWLLLSVLMILALASACGGGGDDDNGGTPQPPVAGNVLDLTDAVKDVARVDGQIAFLGKNILKGSKITTDSTGAVMFEITGLVTCDTKKLSDLQVLPDNDLVIKWSGTSGVSTCAKANNTPEQNYAAGDDIMISLVDPIFGVVLEPEQATVKVISGTALVTVGNREFPLAAGQQLAVRFGEAEYVPFELSEEEIESVELMRRITPLPDLTVEFDGFSPFDDSCEITYTLSNIGEVESRASTVRVEINGSLLDEPAPGVFPDEPVQLTSVFPVGCPFEPDLVGELTADPDDEIAEADEGDNAAAIFVPG